MTTYDNQQNNLNSEFYRLSGESTDEVKKQEYIARKYHWKLILGAIALILVAMWFWWNFIQINSST